MAIPQSTIRRAAGRPTNRLMTLSEAQVRQQTAFLCHSHRDKELAQGIVALLQENGFDVYIDWADSSMPEPPDRDTAARIKQKITSLKYFLYLATGNAAASRWCPWEIGFADCRKGPDNVLIIPTTADDGKDFGNEYLQLYPRIDLSSLNTLAFWRAGETGGRSLRFL